MSRLKKIEISGKLRMTAWLTAMMLLLTAMILVFLLVINGAAVTDDPAGRLVKVVQRNVRDAEIEHGAFDWGDLEFYDGGVYCAFYDQNFKLLNGALPTEGDFSFPFQSDVVRTVTVGGQEYFAYDAYADLNIAGLWVRGLIPTDDESGVMHTVMTLTWTLLPTLLILTIVGGWLIAADSFRPVEKISAAAASITDGDDLSARLALRRGPREILRLSRTFDSMFARLERSFVSQKQFASDASHELRTPLTVILAACDRSRRKDVTREDFLKSIGVIEEQGHRMSDLVEQLLSLTRLRQGTDRFPLKPGDLSAFTESCCQEFIPAQGRGIVLETDILPGVGADFNASMLSRLIVNLLQNAYKYGRENGHVWVSLRMEGASARLSVRDDGVGIAQEDQDRIWQRFWQADSSRGEDGGAGLGLSMVKEIAVLHGGDVSVRSTPGRGSEFIFLLPGHLNEKDNTNDNKA